MSANENIQIEEVLKDLFQAFSNLSDVQELVAGNAPELANFEINVTKIALQKVMAKLGDDEAIRNAMSVIGEPTAVDQARIEWKRYLDERQEHYVDGIKVQRFQFHTDEDHDARQKRNPKAWG